MSSIANVVNGQITNNAVAAKDVNEAAVAASKQAGGSLDKDAFLQLLVTQMKYQDPLEPTDNTEYVSQLATFSELENMQNLVQSTDMQRASMLVGQYVTIEETDSTGNTKEVGGLVDSVVYQNNKAYLSINDTLYNFDDVKKVYDSGYVVEQAMKEQAANKKPEEVTEDKAEEKVEEVAGEEEIEQA